MNPSMKVGLVLSGGGAVGAYEVGVVKALAESGSEIHAIAGASIGALNGAIVASSPNLQQAAERMAEIWEYLEKGDILKTNPSAYIALLIQFGLFMGGPMLSKAGTILNTVLKYASAREINSRLDSNLVSEQPLMEMMNRYLDVNALVSGLPLYVSLYPTEGADVDIFKHIIAKFGIDKTRDSEFFHVQNLPKEDQKEALLASAALPLLFKARNVKGTLYSDGGMGGWNCKQGNTPVTPLVEAGCNMVIVTHLSDGSLWDRHDFPDTTVLEIRPQKSLSRNEGMFREMKDVLGFNAMNINSWIEQGYQDTMACMERIRKPLQARQTLRISEEVLESSLAENNLVDKALKDAMKRIK